MTSGLARRELVAWALFGVDDLEGGWGLLEPSVLSWLFLSTSRPRPAPGAFQKRFTSKPDQSVRAWAQCSGGGRRPQEGFQKLGDQLGALRWQGLS